MKAKKGFTIFWIALIFSVLLFSKKSFGWGNTWLGINLEQIVNSTRGRIGPLRYNLAFGLYNAGYDSDIYYGATEDPVPDYTIIVGPQVSLFLPSKKGFVLDISEIPQYVFYLHTERDRALNNAFRGRLHIPLERLYFQVGGGLTNAKQRVTTEVFVNIRRKLNDYMGLAFWQISKGTAIAFQYRSSTHEYLAPADSTFFWEALNRRENYINLTAYFQELKRARFFLDVEYGSFVFKETISSHRDSRSYGIFGGIEFLPPPAEREQTRGIQGEINLGYKRFDILDLQGIDFEGLVGNTSISLDIIRFTTLQGVFTRDVHFSVFSDLDYYIQTNIGAGIYRVITQRINLRYDFSYSQNDYVQREESDFEAPRRMFVSHSLGLGLRLRDNLQLNLIASFGERAEEYYDQINNRHFIGFNLTYGYISGGVSMRSSPLSRQRL